MAVHLLFLVFMKAIFHVKTVRVQWKPPFRKESDEEEFLVAENETFDHILGNGNDEPVFLLEQVGGGKARVKYSRAFMLKGQPGGQEAGKRIWLRLDEPVMFSYLWGEHGISKTVTYKGVASKEEEAITEQAEQVVEVQEAAPVIELGPPGNGQ